MSDLSGQVITNVHMIGDLDLSGSQYVTLLGGSIDGRLFAHGVKHLTVIGVRVERGVHLKASQGNGVYHVNLTGVHVGFDGVAPEIGFLIETPDKTDYRRSNHVNLFGCTARWCSEAGYRFSHCTGVSLHGCLGESCVVGVHVDSCESLSIHGGHFETNERSDIWIDNGSFRTKEFGAYLGSSMKVAGPNWNAAGNDTSVFRDELKVRAIDAVGHVWGRSFNIRK